MIDVHIMIQYLEFPFYVGVEGSWGEKRTEKAEGESTIFYI